MADVTLFEADLSESKFVAPFGHYHEGDESEESDGGGRSLKLLAALGLLGAASVGALAYVANRKLRGDGGDSETDVDAAETNADGEFDFAAESYETDFDDAETDADADDTGRTRTVAALVGLSFLLLVTALVKLRSADDADDADDAAAADPWESPTAAEQR